jgi:hypothetical protein
MPHSLLHRLLVVIAVACVAVAVPCSAEAAERGTLLKARHVAGLSRAQTAKLVGALGLPGARVRFGVDAYRVTYATVGVDGAPTTATGLVVLRATGCAACARCPTRTGRWRGAPMPRRAT